MVQLYFLSIVLNALAGFLLILGDAIEDYSTDNKSRFSFSSWGFRLALGILTAIIGLLKLFLPMKGPPILGDMLPALGGMTAGFILIFGFYRENSSGNYETEGKLDRIGDMLLHYKKAAGIALLVIAVLHFLFPRGFFL